MTTDMAASLAPIQILFRSKDAVELFTLPDTSLSSSVSISAAASANKAGGGITLHRGKTSFHILNPNGRFAYLHDVDVGLIKCDLSVCSKNSDSNNANAAIGPPFIPDSKSVQLAKCSPCGTYLLTWTKPNSNSSSTTTTNNNSSVENLRIYDAITGKFLHGFSCKKATLSTVQWTHDESLLFHLVSNEVHVYSAQAFQRVGKIRCPNIASFSLPTVKGFSTNTTQLVSNNDEHEKKYLLTTFVMGSNGKPSRVDLLRYPDRMGLESSTTNTIPGTSSTYIDKEEEESATFVNQSSGPGLAFKSLFDAEEVAVHWSPRADAALVLTQTVVDATGESYYGSSHLFLLLENDIKRPGYGVAISVTLPTEATKSVHGSIPILCANWIPNPNIVGPVPFGVISGSMPPLASLHHGITAEPTFLFGRAHRNTMDISPQGRFIVLGGYGNLAGGMEFWDRNKGKLIPRRVVLPALLSSSSSSSVSTNNNAVTPEARSFVTIKEASELSITSKNPAVGHQWSPDGRTYLVSTTSPRMNVDNGVHIYRYDGSLVDETRLPWDNATYCPDKLLCAEYVPAPLPLGEAVEVGKGRETTKDFYYYPDRPQSPSPRGWVEVSGETAKLALATLASQNSRTSTGKGATSGGGLGAASYVPPGARKAGISSGVGGGAGAYVPPGARKGVAGRIGGTLAERMRQDREDMTSKVSGVKITKRTGPVGASSVTSAATVSGVGAAASAGEKSKSALRREKQNLLREKAEREAAEAEQRKRDEERARTEANKADPEKRAKKIKKLLKQIDEIKAKVSSGGEMNDDQRKKIESEVELVKELASLGL